MKKNDPPNPYQAPVLLNRPAQAHTRQCTRSSLSHVDLEAQLAQGRSWQDEDPSDLPSYQERDANGIHPVADRSSRVVDLEAGIIQSSSLRSSHLTSEALPSYSAIRSQLGPSTSKLISRAIADAAARKTPCESPYYASRSTAYIAEHIHLPQSERTNCQHLHYNPATSNNSEDDLDVEDMSSVSAHRGTLLLDAYFEAIRCGSTDTVIQLLDSGLVDPNTTHDHVCTINNNLMPLMEAVKARKHKMAALLLERGAVVNSWSIVNGRWLKTLWGRRQWHAVVRTPLQVAAANGDLPMVKLLVEDFHADDSLISPTDGQTALRLAADGEHSHVVAYLPAQRGSIRLRWLAKWREAASNMNKVVSRIVCVMLFFAWSVPKCLVGCSWELLKNLPSLLSSFLRMLRKVPSLLLGLPEFLVEVGHDIWRVGLRFAKAIPGVCKDAGEFLCKAVGRLVSAVGFVVGRALSLIHLCAVALITWFRNLTWRNIWHGVQDLFHAIFINLPRTIYRLVLLSLEVAGRMLDRLLGFFSFVIKGLAVVSWWVATFIPRKLFALLGIVGTMIRHTAKEVAICWNPKTM